MKKLKFDAVGSRRQRLFADTFQSPHSPLLVLFTQFFQLIRAKSLKSIQLRNTLTWHILPSFGQFETISQVDRSGPKRNEKSNLNKLHKSVSVSAGWWKNSYSDLTEMRPFLQPHHRWSDAFSIGGLRPKWIGYIHSQFANHSGRNSIFFILFFIFLNF